jgi:hypothetical protein
LVVSRNIFICDCLIQMINTVLSLCSLNREFCTGYNVIAFAVTDFLKREVNNHLIKKRPKRPSFRYIEVLPLGVLKSCPCPFLSVFLSFFDS